jgi:lysophospholipid acyltransferase (LPLAT)-like uncharacterized protein
MSGEPRAEPRSVRLLRALLAPLVAWLLRAVACTWRVEIRGAHAPFRPGAPRPLLAALWHENALLAAGLYRDQGIHVAVSRSRDGAHIVAVLDRMGFGAPSRGSSSRGGSSALRTALRQLEAGDVVALLVDGPRGPARIAKSGVISAARMAGVPVLPSSHAARPCLRFGSWDRMRLPLPFARVLVHYDEPLPVPRDASDDQIEALRSALQQRLRIRTAELDAELAGPASAHG